VELFQSSLNSEPTEELNMRDDLVVISIDEAICQFWSEISLSVKIPFLKHIIFLLLLYRKYLNESPQNNRMPTFTQLQSPSLIWRDAANEAITFHIPQALQDKEMIRRLTTYEENLFLKLDEGTMNRVI
jgi:hypothetical protein